MVIPLIVRKIKPEELKRTYELWAIAFGYSYDNAASSQEVLKKVVTTPASRGDLSWDNRWAAFLDDNETMMSCMAVIPYPIQFDGHHTTMAGIGGVATIPAYRRSGGVRACFEAALPDVYKSGTVFSYLYPFSTAFYRKFGYELCCEKNRYRLLISHIPVSSTGGQYHFIEQGNTRLNDIKTVYRFWQEHYNMMVVGEDMEFLWVEKTNAFKDEQYTYLYTSEDGVPKSYVTFRHTTSSDERNIECSRFVFADAEGLSGILNLFVSLGADRRFVTFELPVHVPLELMLPEWSMDAGFCEKVYAGMCRVINVRKALQMARSCGDGALSVEISDDQILENNGIFSVHLSNGMVTEVTQSNHSPDISMGIGDFSRMLIGVSDIKAFTFLPNTTIHTSLGASAPLFFRKDIYITEYF